MGFADLVDATGDASIYSRCPDPPFVRPPGGCGESASVRSTGRCEGCLLRVIVRQYMARLVLVLSSVIL